MKASASIFARLGIQNLERGCEEILSEIKMAEENLEVMLEKAREGFRIERYIYGSEFYQIYLKASPGDAGIRKEYRNAQRESRAFTGKKDSLITKSAVGVFSSITNLAKNSNDIIVQCEEILAKNPWDLKVLKRLGDSAVSKYLETAIYTYEDLIDLGFKDTGVIKYLAEFYEKSENYTGAIKMIEMLPTFPERERKIKDLRATQYSKEQQGKRSRESERVQGESDNRVRISESPKDEKGKRERISELEGVLEDEKSEGRFEAAKQISQLYKELREYSSAIKYRKIAGNLDKNPLDSMEAIAELEVEEVDLRLGEDSEEKWTLVVDRWENLCRNNPSDRGFHLTLGEAYFELGKIRKSGKLNESAIVELQRSYQEREHTRKAGILLGRAFIEKGLEIHLIKRYFGDIVKSMDGEENSEEVVLDANYFLSEASERIEDFRGALDSMFEVYRRNTGWRNAGEKIVELNKKVKDEKSQ